MFSEYLRTLLPILFFLVRSCRAQSEIHPLYTANHRLLQPQTPRSRSNSDVTWEAVKGKTRRFIARYFHRDVNGSIVNNSTKCTVILITKQQALRFYVPAANAKTTWLE